MYVHTHDVCSQRHAHPLTHVSSTEARTSALTSTHPHSCPQQSHTDYICIPNNFPYAQS